MVRLLAVLVLAGASVKAQTITQTFGTGANAFSIDFVEIGNPGNMADTTGAPNPVGSVSYVYNLGKYEISRDQIEKASTAGNLGISLADMSNFGGNGANRPATGVSWNEAARFVNWLNTSKGYKAAYNFTTSGADDNLTLWGAGQYNGTNQYRHKDAYYFLPSLDEWYKGAYGSHTGNWYNFPNSSDSAPASVSGGTSGAVYSQNLLQGPADVTNAGELSPFGTMAQGGNVWEWNEDATGLINNLEGQAREVRGGSWSLESIRLDSSFRNNLDPGSGNFTVGFRVASVPEPSSLSLLLVGGAVLMAGRRRKVLKR